MPRLCLQMLIQAPIERVFDLSRSIDLHRISTAHTQEEAIAGRTSGLIALHETVTWRARHFGISQTLTSRIPELDFPHFFVDEMVHGAFQRFRHEHRFEATPAGTLMTDVFDYTSPLGWLGRLADSLFLKQYMTRFLEQRNRVIKEFAETDRWKLVLPSA